MTLMDLKNVIPVNFSGTPFLVPFQPYHASTFYSMYLHSYTVTLLDSIDIVKGQWALHSPTTHPHSATYNYTEAP